MKKTNWDQYYNKPAFFSRYTRLYTQSWIVNTLNNLLHDNIKLAEFGGGNSCFHDKIIQKCNIRSYTIYDNNSIGIRKFKDKYSSNTTSDAVECDLLHGEVNEEYDVVLSVGLIEHFNEEDTKLIVKKHFDGVKSGGYVIITAPTPTLVYKLIRGCAELFNIWSFPDERPLMPDEMRKCVQGCGEIVDQKLLWAIGLTQYAIVVRAK